MEMLVRTDESCPNETSGVGISTLAPLCGETEFTELVAEMVVDEAPRLFAVVQEYGERVDGRIAAWGIALEGRAEIVGVDGGATMSLRSPERAARIFSRHPDITARVVWVPVDNATPPQETDAAVTDPAQDDGAGCAAC